MNAHPGVGVALLMLALSSARAEASPVVVVTGGAVYSDREMRLETADVQLGGPSFVLSTYYGHNFLGFSPGSEQYAPGVELELDGTVLLDGGLPGEGGRLWFRGEFYTAVGDLVLDTGPARVAPLVSVPFTLVGTIHACIPTSTDFLPEGCRFVADRLDISIAGSGTARATFTDVPDTGLFRVEQLWYEVVAVPEPTALVLMAGGLTVLGARTRRRDRADRPRRG